MWISVVENELNMDLEKIWKSVTSELELTLSGGVYKTWFLNTGLVSIESGVATIYTSNPFVSKTIEERYYSLLKKILDKLTGENLSLVFVVSKKTDKKMLDEEVGPLFAENKTNDVYFEAAKKANLRTDLTFETYAVSSLNQMAYAAATAVSKNLGSAYNPLFLWGGVGVGKTHAMQAVGNAVLKKDPKKKVIFCMGEEFMNGIVAAIQNKSTIAFKEKYRSVDLLLVDDVQFLGGKESVQEEFFHTFNAIVRGGGQIVMTCDRPPREIKIEDRLKSRFEAGLIVDIAKPDMELRAAIIRIKAKQKGVELQMEVAQFLASEYDNARAMEGALSTLIASSGSKKLPISLHLAKEEVGKKEEGVRKSVSPSEVIRVVSDYYGIKIALIKSEKRDRPISTPRQILMFLLHKKLGLTLMQTAEMLERKDHTTILHGVGKIEKLMVENMKLAGEVEEIKRKIYG